MPLNGGIVPRPRPGGGWVGVGPLDPASGWVGEGGHGWAGEGNQRCWGLGEWVGVWVGWLVGWV